ncbi:probable receptor-like protein kinase At5g59700 [Lactuca sativa]|uniref:Protein kinase domain-containing protein n=1 Tax=Lactuca sativa TaxID=4236 RepID=A0A9R1WLN3_LACSA|nr:probable receptor-like protein kinase At5g59700 [Lactuca sativa]KAJ0224741.1 hypothetical protein LSAT_V11C100035400 [Lactuca sativa]
MSFSEVNLQNYLIPLEEINRATENFSQQRCIGGGGFGAVYKGQLSDHWNNLKVAIKRLGKDSHQGEREFRNELEMISKNPSKMRCITWIQRLRICLGAARGLSYLHSGLGEHNRVIHRDVKSSNILLDDNLVAKVCDFGLSKSGPRNQPDTQLYTRVAGTQFYLDPSYHESGIVRKESDVYSFGVVLFEILSGMLVYQEVRTGDDERQFLMTLVRRYYKKEPHSIIDPNIRDEIDSSSFDTFQEIAYQCISLNITERPTMDKVIDRIEVALIIQIQSVIEPQGVLKEEALSILAILSSHEEGKLAIGKVDVVAVLVEVIGNGSPNNKENAAVVLVELCSGDQKYLVEAQELGVMGKLMDLLQDGPDIGKRKAGELLEMVEEHRDDQNFHSNMEDVESSSSTVKSNIYDNVELTLDSVGVLNVKRDDGAELEDRELNLLANGLEKRSTVGSSVVNNMSTRIRQVSKDLKQLTVGRFN